MAEATAREPSRSTFCKELLVAQADIDMWGHANNVVWMQWVQEVAVAHSAAVGLDIARYKELGIGWVVRRHSVEYLRPAFAAERIMATTWLADVKNTSAERRTEFRRAADGACLVQASTLWVMVDGRGRPTRIPDEVRHSFERSGAL